jgi:DNA-binding transcriptional ArsR family regulator
MPATPELTQTEVCGVFHLDPVRLRELARGLMRQESAVALAESFRLLGDLTRVRILDALSKGELCVCDLANLLGLSASAVSHQLRLLRSVRLVRPRRSGRMVYYALDDQHITHLFEEGLRHVEEAPPGPRRVRGRGPRAAARS